MYISSLGLQYSSPAAVMWELWTLCARHGSPGTGEDLMLGCSVLPCSAAVVSICPHLWKIPLFPGSAFALGQLSPLIMERLWYIMWDNFFSLDGEVLWSCHWLLSCNVFYQGEAGSHFFLHSLILPCIKQRWFQIALVSPHWGWSYFTLYPLYRPGCGLSVSLEACPLDGHFFYFPKSAPVRSIDKQSGVLGYIVMGRWNPL